MVCFIDFMTHLYTQYVCLLCITPVIIGEKIYEHPLLLQELGPWHA